MSRDKKIGIYGGSFDPIHFGHLNLAVELMEAHGLDEVWLCPTQFSPFKEGEKRTSGEHRLAMVKLAIEDNPKFKAIDIELKRPGPSYTVDTLKELIRLDQEKGVKNKFYLLLGADTIPSFYKWHNPKEIVELVPLIIGQRDFDPTNPLKGEAKDPIVARALHSGLTPIHKMDISSTDIRSRLKQGLYCRHLIPGKVVDYIYQNRLYCIPN